MQKKKVLSDKQPGKNGYVYKRLYGVIVRCANEAEQERIYLALRAQGYSCRVVVA